MDQKQNKNQEKENRNRKKFTKMYYCLNQGRPTCGPFKIFMPSTANSNFFSYIFLTVSNSMSLLS